MKKVFVVLSLLLVASTGYSTECEAWKSGKKSEHVFDTGINGGNINIDKTYGGNVSYLDDGRIMLRFGDSKRVLAQASGNRPLSLRTFASGEVYDLVCE